MRRYAWTLAVMVGGVVLASFVYSRYRVLPLGTIQKHRAIVVSANSPDCAVPIESSYRTVILQTSPGLTFRINREQMELAQLHNRMTDILLTRMDHTIFLLDKSQIDSDLSLWLEKVLEQEPIVSRICIIDPAHPPVWYPPKYPSGGGGGGSVARSVDWKNILASNFRDRRST